MKCPICNSDLTPLDLVSRTEHVDLCIENGPSMLELDDSGQLVVKKNVPLAKQRKICPICDKTFQTIHSHFKTCALKNDLPPNLMLDYWDKLNHDTKKPKKFPKDLLDNFVAKCTKEGRLGDQVDFARALSLSIEESEPKKNTNRHIPQSLDSIQVTNIEEDGQVSNQAHEVTTTLSLPKTVTTANEVLQNIINPPSTSASKSVLRKKSRLELVSEETKNANIALRIDRELAATRSLRYYEALAASKNVLDEDDEVVIIESDQDLEECCTDESKLFFKSRLKNCRNTECCFRGECGQLHEFSLLMEEFVPYSGASMDANPKKFEQVEFDKIVSDNLKIDDHSVDCDDEINEETISTASEKKKSHERSDVQVSSVFCHDE